MTKPRSGSTAQLRWAAKSRFCTPKNEVLNLLVDMKQKLVYSREPEDKKQHTEYFDNVYTTFAKAYDVFVKVVSIWRTWLKQVIPYIQGPRVLEVSFGTGYLLTQYADKFETYGIDYNEKLLAVARKNLEQRDITAHLGRGNVEALPYEDETFDTIINTMAFSAYPDGMQAMSELHRVLKQGGQLLLIDPNYPANRNWAGMAMTRFWESLGDIIRDMDLIFRKFHFDYADKEIGGFGSIHLYVAEKQ